DRDLAFFGADKIAGQAERNREYAAGANAGENPACEQQRERRRHRAENVGKPEQHQADDHQPGFAEHVGHGAEHRLDDSKSEGEDSRETGGGGDADGKILGHMRQHRIQRAGGQGCRKGRECNDTKRRRHAAGGGHGNAFLAEASLASASKPISRFTSASNSRSGTMLGPSDGARSGSGWVSMKTPATPTATARSEERRVGKECRARWAPDR